MATYTAGAFILSGTPGHSATTVTEIVDFNITDNGGLTMLYQPATTTALEDWSDFIHRNNNDRHSRWVKHNIHDVPGSELRRSTVFGFTMK